jgi:site-specific recombinase XerD
MPENTGQPSPLRRRMIDDMTVRNLSPATQQSYVYAVANFSRFFGRSPDQLRAEEARAYQVHLVGLGRSWSHINQVSCALRFLYGATLGRDDVVERIVSAREPRRLPVVLSTEEVVRFPRAVSGMRNRAALTTAYGTGLRVSKSRRRCDRASPWSLIDNLIDAGSGLNEPRCFSADRWA